MIFTLHAVLKIFDFPLIYIDKINTYLLKTFLNIGLGIVKEITNCKIFEIHKKIYAIKCNE